MNAFGFSGLALGFFNLKSGKETHTFTVRVLVGRWALGVEAADGRPVPNGAKLSLSTLFVASFVACFVESQRVRP